MAEKDWISRYFAPLANTSGAAGLRDDLATLALANGPTVITVDALVEGVHFLPSDPIETVARKLVRVNVSDIYAAGAVPAEALLTLGWPEGRPESDLAGDTVRPADGVFLSLTLTGTCLADKPIRRMGAQADEDLWVTGRIGAAGLGFEALQRGEVDDLHIDAYRVPRIQPPTAAHLIARHASAALDVSDGLLGDAASLASASGIGVRIALEAVPFAGNPTETNEMLRLSTWGDDYQLLFTAEKSRHDDILAEAAESGVIVTHIGETQPKGGLVVTLRDSPVNLPETLGFEHG